MRVFRRLLLVLVGSCGLLLMLTPGAKASEFDQKVIANFSAPFEIPGQILPTGTYVFKVVDVIGSRDIVQVTDRDETRIFATAITVTRYRANPEDKPVFIFEERGTDSPQALQAWYYPGRTSGHQFIYRGSLVRESMTANMSTTPAAPIESSANPTSAAEESPVMSAAVIPSEVDSTPTTEQSQTIQTQTAPETMPSSPPTQELPKTAGTTPLIALIGTLLLGGALGLKILASRVS